jgi:hypothetical protein
MHACYPLQIASDYSESISFFQDLVPSQYPFIRNSFSRLIVSILACSYDFLLIDQLRPPLTLHHVNLLEMTMHLWMQYFREAQKYYSVWLFDLFAFIDVQIDSRYKMLFQNHS